MTLIGDEIAMGSKRLRGVIHGKTIELEGESGIADGEKVEIVLRQVGPDHKRRPGEGFLRTEGALESDLHWDAIMDDIHLSRKLER